MKMTRYRRETREALPREPALSDVLNDPVVRAVMRADGLDPDELARILPIPVRRRTLGSAGQPTLGKAPRSTTNSSVSAEPICAPSWPPADPAPHSQQKAPSQCR